MKLALVAPASVPAVRGGAENLWQGLMQAFYDTPGVRPEFISLPTPETCLVEVLQGYRQFAALDLSGFDRVISTKYPAWAVCHPHHTVYLQHTLRGLYDTYPRHLGFFLPAALRARLEQVCQAQGLALLLVQALVAASAPSWQLSRRQEAAQMAMGAVLGTGGQTAWLALIDGLLALVHALGPGEAFPGPLARACVRLLDAVSLAPQRVQAFWAISQTVARRPDYFPAGVTVRVQHHPTALAMPQELPTAPPTAPSTAPPTAPPTAGRHFLAVSRLDGPKRIDLIMQGYGQSGAALPLWVVGTGPQADILADLAQTIPGVVMKGYLSDAALRQAYAQAVAVVFAPYDEDYGLITVEAFMAGVPVLTTTDAGGPQELVVHGVNGLVVPPTGAGLAAGFAEFAQRAAMGGGGLQAMGEQGRAWVRQQLHWPHLVAQLLGPRALPQSQARPSLGFGFGPGAPRPPRLVVVNTFATEPTISGGRLRLKGLYAALSEFAQVHLISLVTGGVPHFVKQHSPGFIEEHVPVEPAVIEAARRLTVQLGVSAFDIAVALYAPLLQQAQEALARALHEADWVVFSHPYGYPLYERLLESQPSLARPVVYEAHNVESDLKAAVYTRADHGPRALHAVRALELRLLAKARVVAACSAQDLARFTTLVSPAGGPQAKAPYQARLVAENGLNVPPRPGLSWAARRAQAQAQGYALAVFMGSGHGPNDQAVRAMLLAAGQIAARGLSLLPGVPWHLVVIGSCGQPYMAYGGRGESQGRLYFAGLVSDSAKTAWLDRATLGLNPIVSGSGTNLKLAEYAAQGLPVASTPFGARGGLWQPDTHYQPIFAPETAAETAAETAIVDALVGFAGQPADAIQARLEAAHSLARARLDWRAIAQRMAQALG